MALALSKDNFDEQTKSGVVLLDFWAEWCGPCRMLSPVIDTLSAEFTGKASIAKINIDDESELATKYGVRSIPTIFILKDGEIVEQFFGVQTKECLTEALNKHL